MEINSYQRKPLLVEAVQVTDENIYEVAKWCDGDVHTVSGSKIIEVAVLHPISKKQTRASIGDWILKSSQGFKIYADIAFQNGFEKLDTVGNALQEALI